MPQSSAAPEGQLKESRVSYASLYKKKQLALLCLARLVEPLAATSIQSYMFYQLRSFDPSASDSLISTQAGVLVGAKTAAQVCTGMIWGRVADWDYGGRKLVLLIGLLVSSMACIGYGFSRSYTTAIVWQVIAGAFNSNVSIVRCSVAETYPEKRYRVRALMLLPLCANSGMLLGPLVGGLLSSQSGMDIEAQYPYAPPNILIGALYLIAAIGVFFLMEETLATHNKEKNVARVAWEWLKNKIQRRGGSGEYAYEPVATTPLTSPTDPTDPSQNIPEPEDVTEQEPPKSVYARICTFNVFCTMLAHFIISGHLGTFSTIWTIFLSTPIEPVSETHHNTPFRFTGGLGLQPRFVGTVMSILGVIIVFLQLIIYPRLSDRFGTIKVWRFALFAFPIAYILAPYPALFASESANALDTGAQQAPKWAAMVLVLIVFGIGRTGVTPATTLLINDCTPHPSVRATIHATATVLGNLARSVFPITALWIFGRGLQIGVVGLGFWCLTGLAVLSCVASRWVRDGTAGES